MRTREALKVRRVDMRQRCSLGRMQWNRRDAHAETQHTTVASLPSATMQQTAPACQGERKFFYEIRPRRDEEGGDPRQQLNTIRSAALGAGGAANLKTLAAAAARGAFAEADAEAGIQEALCESPCVEEKAPPLRGLRTTWGPIYDEGRMRRKLAGASRTTLYPRNSSRRA